MKCLFENFREFLSTDNKTEATDPESVDTSSFKVKEKLNPAVWDEQDQLRPEVSELLRSIAQDFFESLGIDWVRILDITFTGSLANYNWSQYSDVDLHIIINYDDVDENLQLVDELLKAKRINWNKTHNIKIHDFEVEVYVQDVKEPHASTGVYSVLGDQWQIKPSQTNVEIDWDGIKTKAACLMDLVDDAISSYKQKDYEQAIEQIDRVREKIRKFRKCGLETGGEFSTENLAFKVLRRNGYLAKLSNYKILAYDKMMSLSQE